MKYYYNYFEITFLFFNLEISIYSKSLKKDLSIIFDMIDNDKIFDADILLKKLEEKFGSKCPDLTYARGIIDMWNKKDC